MCIINVTKCGVKPHTMPANMANKVPTIIREKVFHNLHDNYRVAFHNHPFTGITFMESHNFSEPVNIIHNTAKPSNQELFFGYHQIFTICHGTPEDVAEYLGALIFA